MCLARGFTNAAEKRGGIPIPELNVSEQTDGENQPTGEEKRRAEKSGKREEKRSPCQPLA